MTAVFIGTCLDKAMLVTKNHRLPLGWEVALGEMRKTPSWMFWDSYGQLIKPGNQTMRISVRSSALPSKIRDMMGVLTQFYRFFGGLVCKYGVDIANCCLFMGSDRNPFADRRRPLCQLNITIVDLMPFL